MKVIFLYFMFREMETNSLVFRPLMLKFFKFFLDILFIFTEYSLQIKHKCNLSVINSHLDLFVLSNID